MSVRWRSVEKSTAYKAAGAAIEGVAAAYAVARLLQMDERLKGSLPPSGLSILWDPPAPPLPFSSS